MKKSKTESVGFRCTIDMKNEILKMSLNKGMHSSEYISNLVEKELLLNTTAIPDSEKTFIEKQFQSFSEKLLLFFVDNIDKKLINIEDLLSSKETSKETSIDQLGKYMDRIENYAKERNVKLQEETKIKWKNQLNDALEKAALSIEEIIEAARTKQQNTGS